VKLKRNGGSLNHLKGRAGWWDDVSHVTCHMSHAALSHSDKDHILHEARHERRPRIPISPGLDAP
jgi:hypothetical protein